MKKILASIAFLVYIPNLFSYFQQDEWLAFSRLLILKHSDLISVFINILVPTGGHYTPLNLFFIFSEFFVFGLNFKGYIIVSIVLHVICVLLVSRLVFVLTKNKALAFMIPAIFGTLSTTFQAISWVLADAGTHLSTIFTLISLILLFKFQDDNKNKYYYYCILSLVISLFFKEISIANFVVIPIIILLLFNNYRKIRYVVSPFVVLLIFIVFRFFLINFSSQSSSTISFDKTNFLYNFVTIPIKAFVQSIIPYNFLLLISRRIGIILVRLFGLNLTVGTWQFDVFVENSVFEAINIIIFLFILIIVIRYTIKNWKKRLTKVIFVFFVYSLLNGFVFGLSPERVGRISIIDSRDLYLISIGALIFFVVLLKEKLTKRTFYVFIVIYFLTNIYLIGLQSKSLIEIGMKRERILNTIKQKYPDLPDKVVFYFKSDRSYFGVNDDYKILPFQSGLGQTLLVNYAEKENYPSDFFRNQFLWDIKSQGYKEIEGKGFGYFTREDELLMSSKQYNILPESIIAFNWEDEKLVDITNESRKQFVELLK